MTNISGTGKIGKAVNDTYYYDGNGNRYATGTTHTTLELYNRKSQLLYKINPTTQLQDMYIRLGGHTVIHLQKTGANIVPIYLHNNLLGSALAATTAQATTKWTEQYKPYGSEMKNNASRSNPHLGYTGREHNTETGLSYYGARFYDPEIGRFISPDPHTVIDNMPITFNRYAYAADNPYRYKDPNGKLFVTALIGGAIGAVAGAIDGAATGGGFAGAMKGAAIGFGVGFVVGFADPAASEAAADFVVARTSSVALSNVARAATSISVNTAGNMGYNKAMHGSISAWSSFIGAGAGHALGEAASNICSWHGSIRTGASQALNNVVRASADKVGDVAGEHAAASHPGANGNGDDDQDNSESGDNSSSSGDGSGSNAGGGGDGGSGGNTGKN